MKIAIVIVCRNVLAPLKKTIESALALHNDAVEVHVIDGASTDGTVGYLQSLPTESVQWQSEPDRGIYDAMNKGWNKVAQDRFVLYMGAGDTITTLPSNDTLQTCFDRGDRIIIGTCHIGDEPFTSRWIDYIRYGNTAHHQALLIWRALAGNSPFDASMRVYADWEFNLRLFNSGHHAYFDPAFQTYALPGGVSAKFDLPEIWRIAYRHGGFKVAFRSHLIHRRAIWRNRRNSKTTRGDTSP